MLELGEHVLLVVVIVFVEVLSEVLDWQLALHSDVKVFNGERSQVLVVLIFGLAFLDFILRVPDH